MKSKLALLGISLAAAVGTAYGQIVTYNFTGFTGAANTAAATSVASGVSAGAFGKNAGGSPTINAAVTVVTSADQFGAEGWGTAALATDRYLSFSITTGPTSNIDFTGAQLGFSIRAVSTGQPPTTWAVRSSADNFASNLGSGSITSTLTAQSVNLSGTVLNNATVEFRFYAFGNTQNNRAAFFDSVSLGGVVTPVPEPEHYAALAGVALIGFGAWRKWAARKA